jgi:glycosyltransferase involved in cell wall biosynthesis
MNDPNLIVAICTYNRADRLPALIGALRKEPCPVPFRLLVIDNNSHDHTQDILQALAEEPGAPLRFVTEREQGISSARNRAIGEAMGADYLVYIDDDELPVAGFLAAAYEGLQKAACVGGRIAVDLPQPRPKWLEDNLMGFLGELDHGPEPFDVRDETTPLWSGNIGYRMEVFRNEPSLRFDARYSRKGEGIGGGEDGIMFREFLERGIPLRYCPGMAVRHVVEPSKIQRSYFIKLHYGAGFQFGRWEAETRSRSICGVPWFRFKLFFSQLGRAVHMGCLGARGGLRQAMNVAYELGIIAGCYTAWRAGRAMEARAPAGR